MRFVHAADLHIDSPLRGLERYEGAPTERLRGATRAALENLVALCIEEEAAFLLLVGDVFDGAWKDFSTGLFFMRQMSRLAEAKIPVVLVRGNHDAQSSVVKELRLPDNVRILSSRRPESIELPDAGAVVHGQSFAQRAVTEDLAARYPDRREGMLNVGMLHTSVEGREGHEPYAPTSLETLRAKGYDYWALGHVHAREVLSEAPWIVFPGNLQGRHAKETGPKGASLVTVEDGRVARVEHRALDVVRWARVVVDVADAADLGETVDLARAAIQREAGAAEGRMLAARIVLTGRSRANAALRREQDKLENELRLAAMYALGEDAWVEKIELETRPVFELARVRQEASAVGHLARRLDAIRADEAELDRLAAVLADLDKKLPPEVRELGLTLTERDSVRALVDEVEQTLLPRLLEGSEG